MSERNHVDQSGDNISKAPNPPPVSIKAWSQKLLVAILCVASFYGGWKSYESNMVNECVASGGQMIDEGRTLLCKLS